MSTTTRKALSTAALTASAAAALAAVWQPWGAWWQWLATTVVLLFIGAALATGAEQKGQGR